MNTTLTATPASGLAEALAELFARRCGEDAGISLPLWQALCVAAQRGEICINLSAAQLRACAQLQTVGKPADFQPLILEHTRLYLQRYWLAETQVAQALHWRATQTLPVSDADIDNALERIVTQQQPAPDAAQRQAARVSARGLLAVITGAPGTGKTATLELILQLLRALSPQAPPRIALAAPTGKAASRMQESLRQLHPPASGSVNPPPAAQTLHSLLGLHADALAPRYHRARPLALDVLVIDEASMVDLTLMAQVLEALPAAARLILLGDSQQLASVEPGAVLAEICSPALASTPVAACSVNLTAQYRYAANGGIYQLAQRIQQADADAVIALLRQPPDASVRWHEQASVRDIEQLWRQQLRMAVTPEAALSGMNQLRVLCAHRDGRLGAQTLNAELAERLATLPQPTMLTRNAAALNLFNGDLLVKTADGRCAYQTPAQGFKTCSSWRLPAHEPAYALTVHKAQGSEFDNVWVCLADQPTRILTRELLYTAVTRARAQVVICGAEAILRAALAERIERAAGLADKLHALSHTH